MNIDHTATLIQNINKVQKELSQNKQNKLNTTQFFDITTQYQNTTRVLPKENTQNPPCLTNQSSAAATLLVKSFQETN